MSSPMKVVFPAPPPTTNDLTAQQRALLVRKTKKIEQLLGSTPFLVDAIGPIHISLPSTLGSRNRFSTKTRRSSLDSSSSSSSCDVSPTCSPVKRSHSSISSFSSMRNSGSRRQRHSSSPSFISTKTSERWPQDTKIPVLRLAMRSLNIETIPASPPPTRTSFFAPSSSPTSSDEEFSVQFLPDPNDLPSPRNSLVLSTFTIPSENSLRKQKMDRLRKKLGSGVPLQLVFPKDAASSDSDNSPSSSASDCTESTLVETTAPLSPPSAGPKKPAARIAKARDSLVDSALIHRAKRLVDGPATASPAKTRASPPAPPTIPIPDFKRIKERLSFIVENPDEHGNGCPEEFGLSRVSSKMSDSIPEFKSDCGEAVNMWGTRKGYEGWAPATPPKDDAPPTSPTQRLSGEVKKRPLSYRKPVPPIPTDC
ncbi:unnamed protein product [Cyclocybe aegerita]|uniref:Uncharacterized protein n=1 Tax=Cyclocybe aegerita TaxID=1973307 RepID=A0A8S0X8G7_CYCAE|nr:unnamed protein product [Cyclocybe aegerita]